MTTDSTEHSTDEIEVPLGVDELFYSRTDPRGIIQAGNGIFRRVAQYEWPELLGAPHKVVRHRDMPKAVFRILWDAIQKGNPMGAYVKNRSKNGGYYWVFAVVLPIEGGYLSVRLKPTSPIFQKVVKAYQAVTQWERESRIDPEVSASKLREFAAQEGFSSYTSFIAYALGMELTARDAAMNRQSDRRTEILSQMNKALEQAAREQVGLLRSFEALQSIPNNMRIVASRLEPSGGPVSAISENYKVSSLSISERLRSFVAGRDNMYDQMAREVARALFLMGCERVVGEMACQFRDHDPVVGIDWDHEHLVLENVRESSRLRANEALRLAAEYAAALTRSSRDIRRQMLGLDTIRVLGRVECGRMRTTGGSLSSTIDQLDNFHEDIKGRLEKIMHLSDDIEKSISSYLRREGGREPADSRVA